MVIPMDFFFMIITKTMELHRSVVGKSIWQLQQVKNKIFFLCFFGLQIGHLKKGLNPPSVTHLTFGSPYVTIALKTGIITGVIALAVSLNHFSSSKLLSSARVPVTPHKSQPSGSSNLCTVEPTY